MIETPAFATELAKISLLTNVGRINTTMAFFPEMKTALRTYHPVPSLQKTNGNAQDAPRIKNCLKAALLPTEIKTAPPSSPDEILERRRAGLHPPTTIVNLVFVLANHAAPLANVHFDGVLNFLDLFLPSRESDEGPSPFGDDFAHNHPGKAPLLRQMTEKQKRMENVDTNEEMIWGKKMSAQRNTFLQKLVNSLEDEKKTQPSSPAVRGFVSVNECTLRRPKQPHEEGAFMYYVPQRDSPPDTDSAKKSEAYHASILQPAPLQLQSHPHQPRHIVASPVTTPHLQTRTMLQQAWHIVNTTDPLADSDDDLEHADEHVLVDYTRRMQVLSHIERTVFRPR
ncbi:Ino eighty subunit 1 [Termitomyces sp. J132]|nr:Ino eighty subunit 1 [Termitomyces sp. J132]